MDKVRSDGAVGGIFLYSVFGNVSGYLASPFVLYYLYIGVGPQVSGIGTGLLSRQRLKRDRRHRRRHCRRRVHQQREPARRLVVCRRRRASYRQLDVPAYLDGEIYLHGRDIAQSRVAAFGECVVIAASFLMRFPGRCVATPSFELEQAFRLRLEAQHGWSFDSSWPSARENALIFARAVS